VVWKMRMAECTEEIQSTTRSQSRRRMPSCPDAVKSRAIALPGARLLGSQTLTPPAQPSSRRISVGGGLRTRRIMRTESRQHVMCPESRCERVLTRLGFCCAPIQARLRHVESAAFQGAHFSSNLRVSSKSPLGRMPFEPRNDERTGTSALPAGIR
jgi:hypothetical protein